MGDLVTEKPNNREKTMITAKEARQQVDSKRKHCVENIKRNLSGCIEKAIEDNQYSASLTFHRTYANEIKEWLEAPELGFKVEVMDDQHSGFDFTVRW